MVVWIGELDYLPSRPVILVKNVVATFPVSFGFEIQFDYPAHVGVVKMSFRPLLVVETESVGNN